MTGFSKSLSLKTGLSENECTSFVLYWLLLVVFDHDIFIFFIWTWWLIWGV